VIAVLAGGVGAARFLRGLVRSTQASEITAIVNTADDTVLHGLNISPDIDTVTYTLANAIDPVRGWGLENETWTAMEALGRYVAVRPPLSGAAPNWFNLGDKDLATHFYRTARLGEGATLDQVTSEIASAWDIGVRLVPMTNDRVRTIVTAVSISKVRFEGAESARPLGLEILRDADAIIIAPSNPLVSIAPFRAMAGVDEALIKRRNSVVAISPIVAGAALKGPADRLMTELGHDASVVGVARLYSPICSTLIIDAADEHLASAVEAEGMRCVVTNTIMSTPEISEQLAKTALECAS